MGIVKTYNNFVNYIGNILSLKSEPAVEASTHQGEPLYRQYISTDYLKVRLVKESHTDYPIEELKNGVVVDIYEEDGLWLKTIDKTGLVETAIWIHSACLSDKPTETGREKMEKEMGMLFPIKEKSYKKEDITPKKKVFLGGTCNGSKWRDIFIPLLDIDYFNPVVDHWDEEAQAEENRQKELSDYRLYVISPLMKGHYSIAELIDDVHSVPEKTIFCFIKNDFDGDTNIYFDKDQIVSLMKIGMMVRDHGGTWLSNLSQVAQYINSIENGEE